MLAAVAHAIMVAHYPELSYEHSWDGINYNVVDSSGGRGTITFNDKYCVGAFRNENIIRTVTAIELFKGAPQEVLEAAQNETLVYLLEETEDGMSRPYITTAFWADDDNMLSIDNIVRLVQNGGYLLERQFMEYESAVEAWREYYEMTDVQVDLLESIYNRKVETNGASITLTKREIEMIGTQDSEGLSESKISFEEIGIHF